MESGEHLAAKQGPQDAHRDEMALAGRTPPATVGGETTGRDDTVDVWMKLELPGPRVQHGRDAKLGPEPLRIAPEGEESLGRGAQEMRKHQTAIPKSERSQRGREGEDDVEVVDIEDARHALVDPPCLREALALRAVPIATRVVRGSLEAALRAHVEVAAQGGRSADGDRPESLPLLARERLLLAHRVSVTPNNRAPSGSSVGARPLSRRSRAGTRAAQIGRASCRERVCQYV